MGGIDLSQEELADHGRLTREAGDYTRRFIKEEDTGQFLLGCSNYATNRALVYTIEAARNLNAGEDQLALTLLGMAVEEVGRKGRVKHNEVKTQDAIDAAREILRRARLTGSLPPGEEAP
jgi:uncharacterized protein YcsI (UPF0317 family)